MKNGLCLRQILGAPPPAWADYVRTHPIGRQKTFSQKGFCGAFSLKKRPSAPQRPPRPQAPSPIDNSEQIPQAAPILMIGRLRLAPWKGWNLFMIDIALGILIPFLGTALGAACVFFWRRSMGRRTVSALGGFAAGIMTAASVWSLLIPAIGRSEAWGRLSFVPASVGMLCGVLFLLISDIAVHGLYGVGDEGRRPSMLAVAVTLHNLPEGMAVGAIFAGVLAGEEGITVAAALALSTGVAIQNFPEGAIISMPAGGRGIPRGRAFATGVLSGIVEPLGAIVTILAAGIIVPALPYLLGFAAGAMLYVVTAELIPDVAKSGHPHTGNIMFAMGFTLMMALDVAFGG